MGHFRNITLNNYRNFSNFNFNFCEGTNLIIGKNGTGKTNILEAISLFEKGRGFRKEKIINLVSYNNQSEGFSISSDFQNKEINYDINVFSSEKNTKKITVNKNLEKESIKNFTSLFSIIYFLPEMERLFLAPPSFRRNFLDRLIFCSNKNYNIEINTYKKAISERQILLKKGTYDNEWIDNLELGIVKFGISIYEKRISHINLINKILKKIDITKNFSSDFNLKINDLFLENNFEIYKDRDKYLNIIKNNRKIDLLSGGCSIGPHRSDISGFNLKNKFNLNQLSTGQQKTIVLLIIVAQCKYLINDIKLYPVILMDEICSHLDNTNRELLLYLINELKIQVFMTGTDKNFFSFLSTKANYCNIA